VVRQHQSNDVAGQAWYLGPLRAWDIRLSPERAFICIKKVVAPSLPGATLTCDPHVRISSSGQDAFK
jgi:hypothetical protein